MREFNMIWKADYSSLNVERSFNNYVQSSRSLDQNYHIGNNEDLDLVYRKVNNSPLLQNVRKITPTCTTFIISCISFLFITISFSMIFYSKYAAFKIGGASVCVLSSSCLSIYVAIRTIMCVKAEKKQEESLLTQEKV